MISTVGEIQTEVLVRNNRTTTDSFVTDAMLDDWVRMAHKWTSSYAKWPFTEGKATTTYATSEFPLFEGWLPDSIRLLQIGDKRFEKTNFYDFQRFREDYPSDTKRYFTDFARTVYVNPNHGLSGTVTAYGQYSPNIDPTDKDATTVFTDFAEEEGNEAIVEKMTAYLKRREHMPDEAELHDQRAEVILEKIKQKWDAEQFNYKTAEGDGMWKRIDIVEGAYEDEVFKRDQF